MLDYVAVIGLWIQGGVSGAVALPAASKTRGLFSVFFVYEQIRTYFLNKMPVFECSTNHKKAKTDDLCETSKIYGVKNLCETSWGAAPHASSEPAVLGPAASVATFL